MILLGALVIGYISGPGGIAVTKPFFGDLFKGVLCLFMLEMGLVAGQRLAEVRTVGAFLVGFGIVMPIIDGILGVLTGGFRRSDRRRNDDAGGHGGQRLLYRGSRRDAYLSAGSQSLALSHRFLGHHLSLQHCHGYSFVLLARRHPVWILS